MPEPFRFDLVSPEDMLVSEEAEQVLVPGSEGDFTVLSGHAPIIATLRPGLLDVVYPGGREQRFFVRGGFAEAGPESLTVLAQLAIDLDAFDRDVLAQEIKDAEEDVQDAADDRARDRAQMALDQLRAVEAVIR